jgi:outer membrane protein assembly factor BamE
MCESTTQSYRFFRPICARISLTVLVLSLFACASWLPEAHKLKITQGNAVKPSQLSQLKPGMPKAEVRALLGVPVLQDPFHEQRWDYIFRYLPGKKAPQQSRLTLHFEEDVLVKIDDSDYVDPDKILPPPTLEPH